MKKLLIFLFLPFFLVNAYADPLKAPEPNREAIQYMPDEVSSFEEGLVSIAGSAIRTLHPDLNDGLQIAGVLLAMVILLSLLPERGTKQSRTSDLVGAVCISLLLLGSTRSMIGLSGRIIQELQEYGKLLFPVMTTALAAQGGISSATGLYIGTAMCSSLISSFFRSILVPVIYLYLVCSIANCAADEELLKRIKERIKKAIHWFLKTAISIFFGYMTITGAVNGAADKTAVKAAKTVLTAVVPVIGGTLAGASDSMLAGAAIVKNAAGIYGIYAVLAIFLTPFLKIGVHYLIISITASLCHLIRGGRVSVLVEDFSNAMSMLLAAAGGQCIMMLFSLFCYLKESSL